MLQDTVGYCFQPTTNQTNKNKIFLNKLILGNQENKNTTIKSVNLCSDIIII